MRAKLVVAVVAGGVALAGGLTVLKSWADSAATDAVEARIEALKARGLTYDSLKADALAQNVVLRNVGFTPAGADAVEGLRSVVAERATIGHLVQQGDASFADVTLDKAAIVSDDGTLTLDQAVIEHLDTARLEALAARGGAPGPTDLEGLFQGFEVRGVDMRTDGDTVTLDRLSSRLKGPDSGCATGADLVVEGLRAPSVIDSAESGGTIPALGDKARDWTAGGTLDACVQPSGQGRLNVGVTIEGVLSLALEASGDQIKVPETGTEDAWRAALSRSRIDRLALTIDDRGKLAAILDAMAADSGGERAALGESAADMLGMVGPPLDDAARGTLARFFKEPRHLELALTPDGPPVAVADIMESGTPPKLLLKIH
jgi:hypothetical protein